MQQANSTTRPSSQEARALRAVDHPQTARRLFLGPIPYKRHEEDEDKVLSDFVVQHGRRLFVQKGRDAADWTEDTAKLFKEMLKESLQEHIQQATHQKKRNGMMQVTEWVGDTFEVGKVVGVSTNMLAMPEERPATPTGASTAKSTVVHWDTPAKSSVARSTRASSRSPRSLKVQTKAPTSFVTAASHLSPVSFRVHDGASVSSDEHPRDETASSSTPFLNAPSNGRLTPQSPLAHKYPGADEGGRRLKTGLKSILSSPAKRKGKEKAVMVVEPQSVQEEGPVSPSVVLSRAPEDVEGSSAAATAEAMSEVAASVSQSSDNLSYGDVIMRDRMLVRVIHSNRTPSNTAFDEKQCRITRGLDYVEWREFLVIWRKTQIELYEDYTLPCQERIVGHKRLAFVISLDRQTRLSLFSSVDLSFTLMVPPKPSRRKYGDKTRRSLFHRSTSGFNIFIFKLRSRSRAIDWFWNLWEDLGGTLPESFEVICPIVHTRVSVAIPEGDGWKNLTRNHVADLCEAAMQKSFAWQTIRQLPAMRSRKPELCWRTETKLDWVWLKDDVEGYSRDWELLYGMALQYPGKPTQLELRLAEHYPSQVLIKDGKHLEEPPSIEGFVWVVRRKTGVRAQQFLTTHDGYLCSVILHKVFLPPSPIDLGKYSKEENELRHDEFIRLRAHLIHTRGFWDMRHILTVRRASHVTQQLWDESVERDEQDNPGPRILPNSPDYQVLAFPAEVRRTDSDIDDEGGDRGLAAASDKAKRKMYRSFELVLKNGRVIRFETHSSKVAVEWVTHLRALLAYWNLRRRADAETEMTLLKGSLGHEKITVSTRKHSPELPPDPDDAAQYLDEFWNRCVLDGCRLIVKSGRLYTKNKPRAQYTHVHLILVKGYLLQFQVTRDAAMHHYMIYRLSLVDAYVCSGYYAGMALPTSDCDPNAQPVARLFSDGLETKDAEEDTLFMLWYRPQNIYFNGPLEGLPFPSMSAKHKLLICRARSKLERDAWCWALNCQIEILVREMKGREREMREQGMPV